MIREAATVRVGLADRREARRIADEVVREHGPMALHWPVVRRHYRGPLWARAVAWVLIVGSCAFGALTRKLGAS